MLVVDVEDETSPSVSRSVSRGRSSKSRSSSSRSSRSSTPLSGNGSKITEGDFSPRTRQLAIASKAYVRTTIIYGNHGPFPPTGRHGRLDFAWNTIRAASRANGGSVIKDALTRASADEEKKKKLVTFVSYSSMLSLSLTTSNF